MGSLTQGNVDIFVVSETKIGQSFPLNEFNSEGFTAPIRVDRNNGGGGLIFYFRTDIPFKMFKIDLAKEFEGLFFEVNFRNKKWLFFGGYNPKKDNISYFLNQVGRVLGKFIV